MYGDSKNCTNEFYGECDENERICIGRANANFVYAISGKIRNIFPHFTLPLFLNTSKQKRSSQLWLY